MIIMTGSPPLPYLLSLVTDGSSLSGREDSLCWKGGVRGRGKVSPEENSQLLSRCPSGPWRQPPCGPGPGDPQGKAWRTVGALPPGTHFCLFSGCIANFLGKSPLQDSQSVCFVGELISAKLQRQAFDVGLIEPHSMPLKVDSRFRGRQVTLMYEPA